MNANQSRGCQQTCLDHLAEASVKRKKPRKRRYTDEGLLLILRDLGEKLGRTPTEKDVDQEPGIPSCSTYKNRFGGFANALECAGFKVGIKGQISIKI